MREIAAQNPAVEVVLVHVMRLFSSGSAAAGMDTVMVDDAMAIREELEAIAADMVNPTEVRVLKGHVPGRPHRELRGGGGLRPHHHGQSRPRRREGLFGFRELCRHQGVAHDGAHRERRRLPLMASSAAKVAIPSRCERPAPAPAPLWTRNFIAGTFLNFFIAGNYFMLMVVMTAYALTVYQAPAAVAALCASAFIVGTLFSRFAAAPMMERFRTAAAAYRQVHRRGGAFGVVPAERAGGRHRRASGPRVLLRRVLHHHRYGHYQRGAARAQGRGHRVHYAVHHPLAAPSGPLRAFSWRTTSAIRWCSLWRACSWLFPFRRRCFCARIFHEGEGGKAAAEAGGSGRRCRGRCGGGGPGRGARRCRRQPRRALAASTRVPSTHFGRRSPPGGAFAARPFCGSRCAAISVVCGLLFFGYSSLLTFLTPYATEIGLARAASVFFVVYALAMFVTRPFTGRAFDRVGPHPVMVPAFVSLLRAWWCSPLRPTIG